MSNKFDETLSYIENNIHLSPNAILRGLSSLHPNLSKIFSQWFEYETGQPLRDYIDKFKLYCAAKVLKESSASIADIASNFNYSDHAEFSKKMKKYFNCSPSQVRDGTADVCFEKKPRPHEFSRSQTIFNKFLAEEYISDEDIDFLDQIERAEDEFPFSLTLCCKLADVADSMGIAPYLFIAHVFDAVLDNNED